jgi:hypothetical protein
MTSLPFGNLKVVRNVSSKMTLRQIRSRIRSLKGLEVQNERAGIVFPYWGLFVPVEDKLPRKYLEKIRRVIYLENFGDIVKPTSVIIKLNRKDYFKINDRWVRAIKIKGITDRILRIKKGEIRHIRVLGDGNIAYLIPRTNPDGTTEDFRYDVGEPYRAKRFRSIISEIVLSQYAFSQCRAVMAPIGMGIYQDQELLYKGEPIAFSIWGVEHPDDSRFADDLDARFYRMLDEMGGATSIEQMHKALQNALSWMRRRCARIIAEVRRNHDIGLVHYEVHFNNILFFGNSLTIADWEEASHGLNLSRCQFFDGVVADLVRLIEHCCSEEQVYRQHYNRLSRLAAKSGISTPDFHTVNYFMHYFHRKEVSHNEREQLHSLQEKLLTECQGMPDLIEGLVVKLILGVFGRGHFGKGIDWKDVARPFMPGFSDDKPIWQGKATTTFDPRLFVQKGQWPYGKKQKHPTRAIRRAEEAIYQGRFEDAIRAYENILRHGHRRNRDFDRYIHHNLASLYFALRQDKEAKTHFDLKAGSVRRP